MEFWESLHWWGWGGPSCQPHGGDKGSVSLGPEEPLNVSWLEKFVLPPNWSGQPVEAAKYALVTAPPLAHLSALLSMAVDIPKIHTGAVLQQNWGTGWMLVAFLSRKLALPQTTVLLCRPLPRRCWRLTMLSSFLIPAIGWTVSAPPHRQFWLAW
jgi:hypothetical protein